MALAEAVLPWIRKYSVRSIINAPSGTGSGDELKYDTEARILNVDLNAPEGDGFVHSDLRVWKPSESFDAVYINCIFCNRLYGKDWQPAREDYLTLAENYASWPVKHIILYDTIYEFDWHPIFEKAGWKILESSDKHEDGATHVEIWSKA